MRNAASLALPPERSIGTWPTPLKKVRIKKPLNPGVMKYSSFARKVIGRFTINGRKIESINELWLIAMITGPSVRHIFRPVTLGRYSTRRSGPGGCI